MEFLLGKTGLLASAAVAISVAVIWLTRILMNAGMDKQKVKEHDAFEKHMQDVASAARAKPVGSVSDDPNNRDNRH